jgi:hypothetical protein
MTRKREKKRKHLKHLGIDGRETPKDILNKVGVFGLGSSVTGW